MSIIVTPLSATILHSIKLRWCSHWIEMVFSCQLAGILSNKLVLKALHNPLFLNSFAVLMLVLYFTRIIQKILYVDTYIQNYIENKNFDFYISEIIYFKYIHYHWNVKPDSYLWSFWWMFDLYICFFRWKLMAIWLFVQVNI